LAGTVSVVEVRVVELDFHSMTFWVECLAVVVEEANVAAGVLSHKKAKI
jgi:hypothetical protein